MKFERFLMVLIAVLLLGCFYLGFNPRSKKAQPEIHHQTMTTKVVTNPVPVKVQVQDHVKPASSPIVPRGARVTTIADINGAKAYAEKKLAEARLRKEQKQGGTKFDSEIDGQIPIE